ncbi:hypothetical protein [Actinokineospora sp.]|uniref:hypothetical protein n=1 Tax=Actinokineospora sp. TaxID=1872133 RepID=UPI004037E2BC
MRSTPDRALVAYPQLRRLIQLRDNGWMFIPVAIDGRLDELRGVRTWPTGWAEAIRVNNITDAAALRTDPDGRIVWARDGGLVDVVDALAALPAPELLGRSGLVVPNMNLAPQGFWQ